MPRGVNNYDNSELQGRNVANSNSLNIVSPGLITDGLVLHLDAGNYVSYPAAGTTWFDVSNNRNNGTLNNGPTYSVDSGGYLNFDGTDDYVDFATYSQPAYDTSTSFTWGAWVFNNGSGNDGVILGSRAGGVNDFTKLTPGAFYYYPAILTNAISSSVWRYITVIKSETLLYYYQNGALITSTTSSQTKPTKPFLIGNDIAAGGGEQFKGRVAIVKVYNRALSPQEVEQNFNATRARFGV